MTSEQYKILGMIKDKAGQSKARGQETIFKVCPFCGNTKSNFELNMGKSVFHCWACSQGGSVQFLLRHLQIEYSGRVPAPIRAPEVVEAAKPETGELGIPDVVIPIEQSVDASKIMGYLGSRGITKEDVNAYEIMWWQPQGRVIFLFRNGAGNLIFWTARTIYKNIKPKYMHANVPKGNRIISYRGQNDDDRVFLCEGVFDAIRIHQTGKTVIILMGSEISEKVIEYLRLTKKSAVLVMDNDMASKQYRYEEELRKHLGSDKVKAIYLPEKDVADIGIQGGEGFAGFIRSKLG